MIVQDVVTRPSRINGWNVGLWAAQISLAGLFGMSGYMHTFMSPEALASMGIAWATEVPVLLIRFIGICEIAGTIGIILPAALRIMPHLTPLAALGFIGIQGLALPFHLIRGEFAATPFNAVVLAVAVFVLWGRTRKSPITAG